jgi:hypothetical protein
MAVTFSNGHNTHQNDTSFYGIQRSDTQKNDIKQDNIQQNDTQQEEQHLDCDTQQSIT